MKYSLEELPQENLSKLGWVEKKIISARTSPDLSLGQMEAEERKALVENLVGQASAIVGCKLPQTDFFLSIIVSEIDTFLVEYGYADLNIEEVLLAIRINERGDFPKSFDYERIPFFGQQMNVSFLAKVLGNYTTMRSILDRKLQNFIDGYE